MDGFLYSEDTVCMFVCLFQYKHMNNTIYTDTYKPKQRLFIQYLNKDPTKFNVLNNGYI